MTVTACLGCGLPTLNGSRCPRCAGGISRARRDTRYDDPAYKRKRAKKLAEHIRTKGYWCPGFGVPAHYSRDLTLDHRVELSRGGSLLDDDNLEVMCRGCNTRKRHAREASERPGGGGGIGRFPNGRSS